MARLAYLGTPDMAVPPLRALVDAGHDIALCVTRPDRRRGRGKEETPSPVKVAATELGLAVTHDMDDLATAGVELAVVVAYGRIIPARLLEQVPMVNLHFSLLPRWRGAAPVERAILAGDRRDRCLPDEGGGGARHGSRLRRRARVPLDDDVTLDALRSEFVAVASTLGGGGAGRTGSPACPTRCPRRARSPWPRRSARRTSISTGRSPAVDSGGWCVWAGPGPPSAASG